jgi:transketolase
MSAAIGMALSKKLNGDPSLVFSLHGDGELQEGQNWEALMFAPYHKVDNLVITIDHNGQQIDGRTYDVLSLGDLKAKLESFGWRVLQMDGNNMEEVVDTMHTSRSLAHNHECIAIIMHTIMGKGVDFMEDSYKWHGVAPSDEQLTKALAQLEETLGDY